ncbi:MAG: NAD(P)/FAD-dependent oxidoreductase [Dehalococcoidia bacterium]
METAAVVIVGGGISGGAIAYFLARRGCSDVLLLEQQTLGSGSTGAAAGGIRSQFSTEMNIRCSLLSLPFWRRFEEETGSPHPFNQTGYLFLATTREEIDALAAAVALQNQFGVRSRLVATEEMTGLAPALNSSDLAGGAYSAADGVGSPYDALQGYIKAARRLGVRIREGARLEAVETNHGRVQAVELGDGERILTACVVNAAGPWSGAVGALAGLEVPVRPFRREIYVSEPFHELPAGPLVIDLHTGWYYRREGERILMAGIADRFSSWNTALDWSRLPEVAQTAVHRVPALAGVSFTSGWAGSYDISPDNHALLGGFPELEGFICACGFSGHGYMHSPATGMLVSELILDGKAISLDISSLSPTRFREGQPIVERLTTHGRLSHPEPSSESGDDRPR